MPPWPSDSGDWFASLPSSAGDLPTWIAVFAAIYAGRQAGKLLKIENERDREREKRDEQRDLIERRQQADLVAAWRGVVPANPDVASSTNGTYGPMVRNGSQLPSDGGTPRPFSRSSVVCRRARFPKASQRQNS